tara:strand:+ start:1291 stop:2034 length:744 start_codon:yes stop_codon:yes gene_type:complete
MKILVTVKKTIDYNVQAQIASDGKSVVEDGVKMGFNPFCEIALEEAIRIAEKHPDVEITALTIGGDTEHDILRKSMAMGAHRSVLIEADNTLDTLHKAKILSAYIAKEHYDIILMGKQSIDGDHNHIPQMLSALLSWDMGLFCSEIEIKDKSIFIKREVDEGIISQTINLPCILSSDLRLNTPRFIPLPKIIQAKTKPIEKISLNSLEVDYTPEIERTALSLPEKRQKGEMVEDLDQLIEILKGVLK